jgi:DNA-directed RNA polymerase specialized sigma24 family protein
MLSTLQHLAWRKWRIPRDVVEDLLQNAIVTFLEVRSRYPRPEEHLPILVGIFRNKCREHVEQRVRTNRVQETLRNLARGPATDVAVQPEKTLRGGVLGEIIRLEEGQQILSALGQMRPEARELFRLIADERVTRKELLQRFKVNPNTLDTRLHTYRKQLKALIAKAGGGRPTSGRQPVAVR